ncbi:heme ABC transporter ATP-binding protein [Thermoflavimicrobium dichotomicum]|uniref:Iron complex transport system ATP-binding protein n=1 Tax=Thermoflavimicrobium dichotomicum TaxID=46223 RepID=A0A1I3RIP3_9BACL|nr:heme ABC transporter ATP-binding protein [Thermoflavimicrobium dichotomicum]SFJ46443.1 iron complex transport system ATP-binding protein [Thermoflavimicrobium dichotomicum]
MLKAQGLVKSYGSRCVLHEVDLEVERGECVGIVGPNGSGKSTLMKVLIGEELADRGQVWLDGRELSLYHPKERAKKVAVLAQESLGSVPFTVEEVVYMGRYPYQKKWSWKGKKDRQIVEQMMKLMGIEAYRDRSVESLSGGERQRVAIAKALAQEPELLILDEPTTYLDIHYQLAILDLLHEYRQKHQLTMIMVLHDLNLAAQYCDRIVMLKEGKVHVIGRPEQVIQTRFIDEVFEVKPIILSHPKWHVPQLLLSAKRESCVSGECS